MSSPILNYIAIGVIIVLSGIYVVPFTKSKSKVDTSLDVREYTHPSEMINESKKPIMWIHVPHEYNSRHWIDFGSRSSLDLNQPYLFITVKSIIKHCEDSFTICLIDDNSFTTLIPNWDINMSTISAPIIDGVRDLAMAKLVYLYGGMVVPVSFLCFNDLKELYTNGVSTNGVFVCANTTHNITAGSRQMGPDHRFMGALKNNSVILSYIEYIQRVLSGDSTAQSEFLGELDRWMGKQIQEGRMTLIPGKKVGTQTASDKSVLIENLLGNTLIEFQPNIDGIWIPASVIINRTKYEWFARMSVDQVLDSDTTLGKYMVMGLGSTNKGKTNELKEGMTVMKGHKFQDKFEKGTELIQTNSQTVGYWQVPSGAPVWGLMPQGLGNNVRPMTL